MTYDVLFDPAAAVELEQAEIEGETFAVGLGLTFRDAVASILERASENPALYPVVDDAHGQEIRKAAMVTYPFNVLYYVEGSDLVVVALSHTSMRPGYWKSRVPSP